MMYEEKEGTIEEQIKTKIKMLEDEFHIKLSFEDLNSLKSSKDRNELDRVARGILNLKLK